MPTPNTLPGELVEETLTSPPELSVAVGSFHVTETPLEPVGIATLISEGQPVITGSVLSMVAEQEI